MSFHFKRRHEPQEELRQLPSSLGRAVGAGHIGADLSLTVSDNKQHQQGTGVTANSLHEESALVPFLLLVC